jgi:hypothetical protein
MLVGRNCAGSLLATRTRVHKCYNVLNSAISVFTRTQSLLDDVLPGPLGWNLLMKKSRQISLGSSESIGSTATDFTYSMRAKVISITYLGTGSIHIEIRAHNEEDDIL